MKLLLMSLILAGFAMPVHAKKTTTCTTEKGTVLTLEWKETLPVDYISLEIKPKGSAPSDRTDSVRNFGTSAGSPRFVIDDFPSVGEETEVSLGFNGNFYYVGKKGWSSKHDFEFTSCDTTSAEETEPAGPGGF